MAVIRYLFFVVLIAISHLVFKSNNAMAASGQCGALCVLDITTLTWTCTHNSSLGSCGEGVCYQGSGNNMATWYQNTLTGPPLNTNPTGWEGCTSAISNAWECLHDCQDITAPTHGSCTIEDGGRTLDRSPDCSGGYACDTTGGKCVKCTRSYHGSCFIAPVSGDLLNGCCEGYTPKNISGNCACDSTIDVCDESNPVIFPGPCLGQGPGESNCCTSKGYICDGPAVATGKCRLSTTPEEEEEAEEGECEKGETGICVLQLNGEVLDSCCPGSLAQAKDTNGDGKADSCTCNPSKDAVCLISG